MTKVREGQIGDEMASKTYVDAAVKSYAQLYFNDNSVAQDMSTANTPIGVFISTPGPKSSDWLWNAGATKAITAYSDYSGTVAGTVKITAPASFISDGVITIRGSTNYNGLFTATFIDGNSIYITHSWDGDDGASDLNRPASLGYNGVATRFFRLKWGVSVQKSAGATATVTYVCYNEETELSISKMQRQIPGTDIGVICGDAIVSLSSGNRVSLIMESSNTNNLTNKFGTLTVAEL